MDEVCFAHEMRPCVSPPVTGSRGLTDLQQARLQGLLTTLSQTCPTCRLRLNRNAKTMLSLRGRQGGSVVSVHIGLLTHPEVLSDIPGWVLSQGRRTTPRLRQTLQLVWREQRHQQAAQVAHLELDPIPLPFDLVGMFTHVHRTWFSHLPRPAIRWARQSPQRTLNSIRFACYRRRPQAAVVVNPRLARPWVARLFVEHVLYHELCHHAQAHAPIRGESPHSRRFREWESQYPHHALATAWESQNLDRFLGA